MFYIPKLLRLTHISVLPVRSISAGGFSGRLTGLVAGGLITGGLVAGRLVTTGGLVAGGLAAWQLEAW